MGETRLSVCLFVLSVYCLVPIYCSCSYSSTYLDITALGREVRYCKYKGLAMLPGSVVYDKESCIRADCSETELTICGIGLKAGHIGVPYDCKVVADGCSFELVCETEVTFPHPSNITKEDTIAVSNMTAT